MKFRTAFLLLFALIFTKLYGQSSANNSIAIKLVKKSMLAMGGEVWKSVQSLSFDGYGYENLIDESERPGALFIPRQILRSTLKDLSHNIYSVKQTEQLYSFKSENTYLFNDQAIALKKGKRIIPTQDGQNLQDELNLSPESILKKALASRDLIFLKDTILQKAKHSILFFRYERYPVRFFLNEETDLITAVEITKPYDSDYSAMWGDIKKTILYSFWMILDKGLHYPLIQDTYVNGWYKGSFIINKWKVNPSVNTDSLKIPEQVKIQAALLTKDVNEQLKQQLDQNAKEIMPGIWFLPGPCNSTAIEQPDGIIVIESSYSSFYGQTLINKAKALFPGRKIKALISTSDAWLHIGGVRSFAAIPGIKIYHPARNRFIIEKLLKAAYITEPDEFAKTSKPTYTLMGVSDSLAVGSGKNRVVIYAYKTETGDRQMMVYFPRRKLLYTSDLYQIKRDDGIYWNPQIVWEVYHSVKARKLDVQQFYAMHSTGLIPFQVMEDDFKSQIE